MIERVEKRYKYPLWATLSSTVPSLILLILGLATLPRGVSTTLTMLFELIEGYPLTGEGILFLVGPLVSLIFGGLLSTLYTEIIVTDKGMRARIFILKWVFIPWEDVLGITITPVLSYSNTNLMHFIRVKKLTPFHQLAGLIYMIGSNPVLIINWHMNDYEEIIHIIKEHTEENRNQE